MADIIRFPGASAPRRPVPPLPSFLHGWASFMTIVEPEDIEALPIRGRATDKGPEIQFNTHFVEVDDIEDWGIAILWLSPCVMQIAAAALAEGLRAPDGYGRFQSYRWKAFREEVLRTTTFEKWPEILEAAKREGIDFIADQIAACLLIESGLSDHLETA